MYMRTGRAVTHLGVFLTIVASGCRQDDKPAATERPTIFKGRAATCNLLLVTLDTTRADRIGSHGPTGARTIGLRQGLGMA
jgi:hypothetical protein